MFLVKIFTLRKIITGSSQKKMTASGPLTLKSSQAIKARDLKCQHLRSPFNFKETTLRYSYTTDFSQNILKGGMGWWQHDLLLPDPTYLVKYLIQYHLGIKSFQPHLFLLSVSHRDQPHPGLISLQLNAGAMRPVSPCHIPLTSRSWASLPPSNRTTLGT